LDLILVKFIRDKQPEEVISRAREERRREQPDEREPLMADKSVLIESFVRDSVRTVDLLDELAQNAKWAENSNDLRKFITTVHGIKSSLANIGRHALSETAALLEKAGRNWNIEFIYKTAPDFAGALRILNLEFETEGAEYGSDDNPAELHKQFLEIGEYCADYNRKGALDAISGMKGLSRETMTALQTIKEHINDSDFDKAEKAAAEYANTFY
jgi:HPt (histidine-containing phosphotransfer) domain-containing protein